MAANIQAYLENLQQPWGQIYYDILFDQLKDIKDKRVLDFGSGFGLVANHLAQDNQVLAVEPNQEMVDLRAQAYDLDLAVEDLALEVQDYQGIRVFYALQDNRFKGQESWRESMLKMELAVCQESPYRDIAFFQHYSLKRS